MNLMNKAILTAALIIAGTPFAGTASAQSAANTGLLWDGYVTGQAVNAGGGYLLA